MDRVILRLYIALIFLVVETPGASIFDQQTVINDDSLFNEGDIIVTCDVLGGTLCQDSVQCIGTTKRCKIEQDCNDLSDEKDCTDSLLGYKTQIPSEEDEFQCSDVSKCLTRDLLCDGIPNCRNGEKEPLSCVLCGNFGKVNSLHGEASNATVILRCKPPMGSLPPNITWYKSCCGRSLSVGSEKSMELIRKGVSTNDLSNFRCDAENMTARREGPLIRLEVQALARKGKKTSHSRRCPVGEFRCKDSPRCIPKSKRCGGYKDCRNGEDEPTPYANKTTCQPDEFTCKKGTCTKMNWKCDNKEDCGDYSEETDCPPTSSENTTPLGFGSLEIDLSNKSRLTHKSKKIVLSPDFLTESSQIYWSNRKRIYQLSRHNGNNEAVKSRPDDIKSVGSRAVDGPPKKSLSWTDSKGVVMEVSADLSFTEISEIIEKNVKSQRAIFLSNGFGKSNPLLNIGAALGKHYNEGKELALARKGKRASRSRRCPVDEFRCKDSPRCIPKSKRCDGYKDCKNGEDEPTSCNLAMLASGSQSGLYRIDLRNTSRVTHIKSKEILSLDFGLDLHQIYWSDERSINKLYLNNGSSDEITFRRDDFKIVDSLAVDSLANKVYWADSAQDAIYVGDLRNRRKVKLIEEDLYFPIAIVLSQGYIFWTADCCPRPKIERARLDGTDRKILVIDGIQSPSGLAIDKQDKKIYWAGIDANKYGIIEVISLDDLSRTVIFHRPDYQPFSLDVFEDYVYWSDLRKNAVLRINKSNGNGEEVIMAGLKEPKGLKILHQHQDVPGGTCVYNNGGCDHVCLNRLNPSGQVCLCEEGFELSEDGKTCTSRTCEKELFGNITRQFASYSAKESQVERTLYANTWLLIIILLLLALVLGKRVFKKVYSWLKAIHPGDVQGTRAEDQERTVRTVEDFATDNTDIMHESALLLNYDDDSPELNQQVCTAETKGACVHRGDLPFKVQGDLVVYMNMNTVNINTMSMNMNNTNNVELQQNGGVTVVGDKTNINYHQPPQ